MCSYKIRLLHQLQYGIMRMFNCVFKQCTYLISDMPWEFFVFKSFNSCCHVSSETCPYLLPDMWSPSSCSRHDKLRLQFWYLNSSANIRIFEMWLHCNYLCPDLEMSDDSRDFAFCSCCRVWYIVTHVLFFSSLRQDSWVCVCVYRSMISLKIVWG